MTAASEEDEALRRRIYPVHQAWFNEEVRSQRLPAPLTSFENSIFLEVEFASADAVKSFDGWFDFWHNKT